jgi:hypothetical protein
MEFQEYKIGFEVVDRKKYEPDSKVDTSVVEMVATLAAPMAVA